MESVAIYCRLSREDGDDAESNSIKTQKMIIENYCKRQGWAVYDTYVDDGYSGTNFDRPGFQRMYQDVIDAKVNVVISKDLSRLGRNYILTGYYYQVFFPEAGVRFIAVNDHIDTKNENHDMAIAAFKNIMNDLHSKQMGKSISAARRIRIENKHNCNCRAPYGYDFNNEHVLVPDPEVAPIIKFIFEEYVRDPNSERIAALLNEKGIPSRGAYMLQYAENQTGGTTTKWKRDGVICIIRHPAYMGAVSITARKKGNPYSRKYVKIPFDELEIIYDCHEAIVTRELWEQANELRLQKKKTNSGFYENGMGLYSRKIYCAHCGKALKGRNYNGVVYLTCKCWPPRPRKSNRGITTLIISRHLLYEIRRIALICEADEQDAYAFILQHLGLDRDRTRVEIEIEMNTIQKRIEILCDKISNFEKYTSTRNLQQKQKDAILGALESKLREEEQRLEMLQESDCAIPSGMDIYQFVRAARRYGYIHSIEKPVLDDVVDKIYITKKMNETNYQQDRVLVKYKYIGVLSGIYKPRAMGELG